MAIQEKVMGAMVAFRFHFIFAALLAAATLSLLAVGPSFATVLSFFWPLLLSTAFLLVAVVVLLRISPPPGEAAGEATGEELMDYVAGRHLECLPTDDARGSGPAEEETSSARDKDRQQEEDDQAAAQAATKEEHHPKSQ